jgi:hypothetical protein
MSPKVVKKPGKLPSSRVRAHAGLRGGVRAGYRPGLSAAKTVPGSGKTSGRVFHGSGPGHLIYAGGAEQLRHSAARVHSRHALAERAYRDHRADYLAAQVVLGFQALQVAQAVHADRVAVAMDRGLHRAAQPTEPHHGPKAHFAIVPIEDLPASTAETHYEIRQAEAHAQRQVVNEWRTFLGHELAVRYLTKTRSPLDPGVRLYAAFTVDRSSGAPQAVQFSQTSATLDLSATPRHNTVLLAIAFEDHQVTVHVRNLAQISVHTNLFALLHQTALTAPNAAALTATGITSEQIIQRALAGEPAIPAGRLDRLGQPTFSVSIGTSVTLRYTIIKSGAPGAETFQRVPLPLAQQATDGVDARVLAALATEYYSRTKRRKRPSDAEDVMTV